MILENIIIFLLYIIMLLTGKDFEKLIVKKLDDLDNINVEMTPIDKSIIVFYLIQIILFQIIEKTDFSIQDFINMQKMSKIIYLSFFLNTEFKLNTTTGVLNYMITDTQISNLDNLINNNKDILEGIKNFMENYETK